MQRSKRSMPAIESSEGQAGDSSDASRLSRPLQRGGRHFAELFIGYTIFFGIIGLLLSSWFPLGLGAFLFFTNDEFIEWVLQKIGIRLVPDTLGSEFIKAFVFLTASVALLTYWKESAPAWLLPWISTASWPRIVGAALLCAVLATISTAVVRKLLPRIGIEITPNSLGWTITKGLIGLSVLGILVLLASTSMVSDLLGGH
jgi:hypothetical protein